MDQHQREVPASGLTLIAEAGTGHGGNFELAVQMVEAAARAGATHVKFQHVDPDVINETIRGWYQKCYFRIPQLANLKAIAEGNGLKFLCTPQTWADFTDLARIGVEEVKISSDNIRNVMLLTEVGKWDKTAYISTGQATQEDLQQLYRLIRARNLRLMVCTSEYPCPPEHVNLRRLMSLGGIPGFSDHTLGRTAALVAFGLGARIFEKHFAIDGCSGPDMAVSVDEAELTTYFMGLREAEIMLGDGKWRTE
jgi:sialic acid synthase SpsE